MRATHREKLMTYHQTEVLTWRRLNVFKLTVKILALQIIKARVADFVKILKPPLCQTDLKSRRNI